jgi:hypothetical protein
LLATSILFTQRRGRGGILVVSLWSRATADDGAEGVAEQAARAAVEAMDVFPVPRLSEEAFVELHATPVIQLVPEGDGLGGKTAVSVLPETTNELG